MEGDGDIPDGVKVDLDVLAIVCADPVVSSGGQEGMVRIGNLGLAPAGKGRAVPGQPGDAVRKVELAVIDQPGDGGRLRRGVIAGLIIVIVGVDGIAVDIFQYSGLRAVHRRGIDRAAVGMIFDGRRGHPFVDGVQEHRALALNRGHISGKQMEGLAGTVDPAAVVLTDAPADKLIALRGSGDAGHHDVRVIGIGIAVQLQIQRFVVFSVGQLAIARVVLKVENARLHPAQAQGDVMIDDALKVVALVGFADLVAVAVEEHLVPAGIAVYVRVVLEGFQLRGFAGNLGIVGLAVLIFVGDPGVGIPVIGPVLFHIIPGAGVGFHIVALDGVVLLEGIAVFLPHPGGACAVGGFAAAVKLVQLAVIGVDLDQEPLPFPAGPDGEIGGGHGAVVCLASGIAVPFCVIEEHPGGAGRVRVPAYEFQTGRGDFGHRFFGNVWLNGSAIIQYLILDSNIIIGDRDRFGAILGIPESQFPLLIGHVRLGIPVIVDIDGRAVVGRDGRVNSRRTRRIINRAIHLCSGVMIRMIWVAGFVGFAGQLRIERGVHGVEVVVIVQVHDTIPVLQETIGGINSHAFADGSGVEELFRKFVLLPDRQAVNVIDSPLAYDDDLVLRRGARLPLGVKRDGGLGQLDVIIACDIALRAFGAAGRNGHDRDSAVRIIGACHQTAVGNGDLYSVGKVHFVGLAIQRRVYIPALEFVGRSVGGGIAGHPVAAGQARRTDAVIVVGVGIIRRVGAGRAGIEADPFDRPENRVEMAGPIGVIPSICVGLYLLDRIAVVIVQRARRAYRSKRPAHKDHLGIVHVIRVFVGDAVLAQLHAPVFAGLSVQIQTAGERYREGAGFLIVLIMENGEIVVREFGVQMHHVVRIKLERLAEIILVDQILLRGCGIGRPSLIPAGEGGLLILRVDGILRRDGALPFPDDLHVSGAFRVCIQIVRLIFQILVQNVEVEGAHMHVAAHRVHREAVGRELDRIRRRDGRAHLAYVGIAVKVENMHVGVFRQRFADQRDGYLHVALRVVNVARIGLVHDLDIERAGERQMVAVGIQGFYGFVQVEAVIGRAGRDFARGQRGACHRDAGAAVVFHRDPVRIAVAGLDERFERIARDHVHREAVRGEGHGFARYGGVHFIHVGAFRKVQYVHVVVGVQAASDQTDGNVHLAVGLVFRFGIVAVDDLDIEGAGKFDVFGLYADLFGALGDISRVFGARRGDLAHLQRGVFGDAQRTVVGDRDFIGVALGVDIIRYDLLVGNSQDDFRAVCQRHGQRFLGVEGIHAGEQPVAQVAVVVQDGIQGDQPGIGEQRVAVRQVGFDPHGGEQRGQQDAVSAAHRVGVQLAGFGIDIFKVNGVLQDEGAEIGGGEGNDAVLFPRVQLLHVAAVQVVNGIGDVHLPRALRRQMLRGLRQRNGNAVFAVVGDLPAAALQRKIEGRITGQGTGSGRDRRAALGPALGGGGRFHLRGGRFFDRFDGGKLRRGAGQILTDEGGYGVVVQLGVIEACAGGHKALRDVHARAVQADGLREQRVVTGHRELEGIEAVARLQSAVAAHQQAAVFQAHGIAFRAVCGLESVDGIIGIIAVRGQRNLYGAGVVAQHDAGKVGFDPGVFGIIGNKGVFVFGRRIKRRKIKGNTQMNRHGDGIGCLRLEHHNAEHGAAALICRFLGLRIRVGGGRVKGRRRFGGYAERGEKREDDQKTE